MEEEATRRSLVSLNSVELHGEIKHQLCVGLLSAELLVWAQLPSQANGIKTIVTKQISAMRTQDVEQSYTCSMGEKGDQRL